MPKAAKKGSGQAAAAVPKSTTFSSIDYVAIFLSKTLQQDSNFVVIVCKIKKKTRHCLTPACVNLFEQPFYFCFWLFYFVHDLLRVLDTAITFLPSNIRVLCITPVICFTMFHASISVKSIVRMCMRILFVPILTSNPCYAFSTSLNILVREAEDPKLSDWGCTTKKCTNRIQL